jgi:protein-tyrosine-phosphatase
LSQVNPFFTFSLLQNAICCILVGDYGAPVTGPAGPRSVAAFCLDSPAGGLIQFRRFKPLRIQQLKKILFVCSGNTCRSPLAEGIARKIFSDRVKSPVTVSSAGSSAFEGAPASPEAVRVASRYGVDITGHQSRLLGPADVRDADLIVTMGEKHRSTVGVIDPDALPYTVLLTSFCGQTGDVPDPIGGGMEAYERVYELIHRCLEKMADGLDEFGGWKTATDI